MSTRPGRESDWPLEDLRRRAPRTAEELRALDAEARLLGVRYRVVCPLCGLETETGRGHIDSVDCAFRSGAARPREVSVVEALPRETLAALRLGADPKTELEELLELAATSPAAGFDEDLEARLAAARLSRDDLELEVVEAIAASKRPPTELPPEPEPDDELLERDARARLGGRGTREKCPLCGEGFIAGKGHLGSDFCLVKRTIKRQAAEGFVRVDVWQWSKKILAAGGVEVRWLPGRLEPESRGRPFRGVVAADAPFAPRWALRVLRATKGWTRKRRVALLEALQLPELSEALEFVRSSKRVPRGLLSAATELPHTTRARLLQRWDYGQRHPDALIFVKLDRAGRESR